MKARARFYNRQIDTCEVQVEDGEVKVWDPIAGAFTRCHSLNRRDTLRILRSADTVGLENPWSQAGTPEPWTWAQIKQWARDHVHHSDRHNWLRVARRAFDRRDGAKLGIMVLGS
jgi:hypothetical protein